LLGSALNEQGGGASLRLGRGGIPPTPPFRLALALNADGICANEVGAPLLLRFGLSLRSGLGLHLWRTHYDLELLAPRYAVRTFV